ncbi:hypothetical protein [Absidia glauca]|uniref:Uncharacterized protein n=1 Tax=Absidia glauca TaxID=4829 RepID=A0A163JJ62_ABSGL|nr:hypothetical protein [Absidia glauca]
MMGFKKTALDKKADKHTKERLENAIIRFMHRGLLTVFLALITASSAAACGSPTVIGGASIQRGGYAKQGPVAGGIPITAGAKQSTD